MKTLRILLAALIVSVAGMQIQASFAAQQTPAKQTGLSAKVKLLCGTWRFVGSATFDMPQDPTEKQKADLLTLDEAGTFRFVLEGTDHTGKWIADNAATLITLTDEKTNEVFKLKVLEKTATRLKVDYRDKDEIHNILIYEKK